ncbi:MAG: cache domain-containing protein [Actinomycetota bacterium]|nr:cache domain-containing protein [Actinomycetota bacterium]
MTTDVALVVAAVETLLDEVFGYVASLRLRVEDCVPHQGTNLSSDQLRGLDDVVSSMVSAIPWVGGGGFVAALDTVDSDHRFWQWWTRAEGDSPLERLHPPRTSTGGAEYAYEARQWFREGERGVRSVFGPFVDFAGVNQLVILCAEPVVVDGRFLGVAGADLVMDQFEVRVVRLLRGLPGRSVLVGATGRVIASTVATQAPGERFEAEGWRSVTVDPGRAEWTLVTQ